MKTQWNSLNSNPRCPKVRRPGGFCSALLIALGLALMSDHGWAATNIVLATDSLQQKIDAAAPGDVMVLESGAYSGNISIGKPLSFVRSGTNAVQWLGSTSISTTGKIAIIQMNLTGAVTGNGGIDLLLQDSVLNSTLNVSGGKLTIKRCSVAGQISLASLDFTGMRLTNSGGIYATATVGTGRQFVLTQSAMDIISITGFKSWLVFNSFSQAAHDNCDAVVVGNFATLWHPPNGTYGAISGQSCRMRVYNNRILARSGTTPADQPLTVVIIGVWLNSCTGEVVNNSMDLATSAYYSSGTVVQMHARGIQTSSGGPISVKGNAIQCTVAGDRGARSAHGIIGGAEIVEVSYCCFNTTSGLSGVTPYQCLFAAPGFNGDYTLAFNSPCINAGPPEAFSKDRDGTRNDIGFTGGPLYQPNGATTSNPLLFLLMPAQRQVWKNAQPTLDVEAAATAGH